jgi:cell pole-organizing protein PopZ
MKVRIFLSTIAATLLLSGCGGGGGSTTTTDNTNNTEDSTESNETTTTETQTLSGTIIDGYVKYAVVSVAGHTTTTDENGTWSIDDVDTATNYVVEAKGGIDTSTGEVFEGVLKGIVDQNNTQSAVITPLSTIVTSMVESGKSVEDAESSLSQKLGISKESLRHDPIVILSTGDSAQKAEAARVIKKALVVQKMAEAISKSASTSTDEQNEVFDSVMDSVADMIADDANESFDAVVASTEAITEKTAQKLTTKSTVTSANISEKLQSANDAIASVVSTIESGIDETTLATATDATAELNKKAKSIEVVTTLVENAVKTIAESTSGDTIDTTNTLKTLNAIVMMGGVDGMEKKLGDDGADASDLVDSFETNNVIETQSSAYDTLVDMGMDTTMIAEVAAEVVKSDSDDFTAAVSTVVESSDNEELKSQVDEISTILEDSTKSVDDVVQEVKDEATSEDTTTEEESSEEVTEEEPTEEETTEETTTTTPTTGNTTPTQDNTTSQTEESDESETITSTITVGSEGWGEKVIDYDINDTNYITFTVGKGIYNIYLDIANGDSSILAVLSEDLRYEDGSKAVGDILAANYITSTTASAYIKIENSENTQKTYKLPISAKNKFTDNSYSTTLWAAVVEDVDNPLYTTGGSITLGSDADNSARILEADELHSWSAVIPEGEGGIYSLQVTTDESVNKLMVFDLRMVINGNGEIKVANATSTGALTEQVSLTENTSYQITIQSTQNQWEALGKYSIKLIKQ